MKALSMKQPVLELILQGRKTIETRTWNTRFRGRFYLHASKEVMHDWIERLGMDSINLTRGAILGTADMMDVIVYNNEREFARDYEKHLVPKAKKFPTYGYVLQNPHRIDPVHMKGRLGFFEVSI